MTRLTDVPLTVIPGGGHEATVWRAALGPMLQWMTPQLTSAARQVEIIAAREKSPTHRVSKGVRTKGPATVTGKVRPAPTPSK
jgi:hypothetical protein